MRNDSSDRVSRPWWSRLRFSVRAMAAVVLVVGAAFGWVARGERIQRRAALAIRRAGGQVVYDYLGTGTWHGIRVPRWLGRAISVDFLGNARSVVLQERGTDIELAHVANLPRLDYLDLYGATVTDRGLAHLEHSEELCWLNLCKTGITDAGLAHLARLGRLQDLYLDACPITDAGLEHLKDLRGLIRLSVEETAITDAGLKHLAGLDRLRKLSLDRTAVTDAGLEELQQMRPDLEIYTERGLYRSASRRAATPGDPAGSKRARRSRGG